ncbi:MAG: DUF1559 domain-containing protein [Planctomycetota bacterium]
MLVVIAIIGILISLSLPAVQAVRERGRAAQCMSNLRGIGVAMRLHDDRKMRLPGFLNDFGFFSGGMDPADPGNHAGNVPPHRKLGGWQVAILGDLDKGPMSEIWTLDRYPILSDGRGEARRTPEGYSSIAAANQREFVCPSSSVTIGVDGRNNYAANVGFHRQTFPFQYTRSGGLPKTVTFSDSMAKNNGLIGNRYAGLLSDTGNEVAIVSQGTSLSDIRDGLGQTILVGENAQAQPWNMTSLSGNTNHLTRTRDVRGIQTSRYPSDSRYLQGIVWHFEDNRGRASAPPVDARHRINGGDIYNESMNRRNRADLARPSSMHPQSVHLLFASGSVRVVDESMDYSVYQALMTPRTKTSDVPDNEVILSDGP